MPTTQLVHRSPPRVRPSTATTDVRVVIAGDRGWTCTALARRVLTRLRARYGPRLVIVHADRPEGVVGAFDAEAARLGVRRELLSPGRAEGQEAEHKLHQDLIDAGAAFVLVAHRYLPKSRASRDVALRALVADVPVFLLDSENAEPRRIEKV